MKIAREKEYGQHHTVQFQLRGVRDVRIDCCRWCKKRTSTQGLPTVLDVEIDPVRNSGPFGRVYRLYAEDSEERNENDDE
jgi:hypothetical protein